MVIGIPTEIKDNEFRVGCTPAMARAFTESGHEVLVQSGAGMGSGFSDNEYVEAGAEPVPNAKTVYSAADMIIKVKEPLKQEYSLIRDGQIVFTYLHLAADKELTKALIDSGCIAIAYECVTSDDRRLPLLVPMSEIAGRMATHIGAYYLAKPNGGPGILLQGVPGVKPAKVLVIGGGSVGYNAAKVAAGMGADVTILEKSPDRIRFLDDALTGNVDVVMSDTHTLVEELRASDLVIGAVLRPGAKASVLVKHDMLGIMKQSSVIVDVAVDQGGCVETTHPTTHSNPTYYVDGILHYAVANMPGAFPRTSTIALTGTTLPYALKIADLGVEKTISSDKGIADGVNIYRGRLVSKPVADAHDLPFSEL